MPRRNKLQRSATKREQIKNLIGKERHVVDVDFLRRFLKKFCCGAVKDPRRKNDSKSNLCQQRIYLSEQQTKGFATKFLVKCQHPAHTHELWTSETHDTESHKHHKVNKYFVVADLMEGIKHAKLNRMNAAKGCGTIDYNPYRAIRDHLYEVAHSQAESCKQEETSNILTTYGSRIEAAFDGTWSKRYGFNAKFGIIICIHNQTRKVIGTQVYSNFLEQVHHCCNCFCHHIQFQTTPNSELKILNSRSENNSQLAAPRKAVTRKCSRQKKIPSLIDQTIKTNKAKRRTQWADN